MTWTVPTIFGLVLVASFLHVVTSSSYGPDKPETLLKAHLLVMAASAAFATSIGWYLLPS